MNKSKQKITLAKLKKLNACQSGIDWFVTQTQTELDKVLFALLKDGHANWANWLIVHCMTKTQKVRYAVYAARQVLSIFEKKYPNDKRPRNAIEAAEKYLKNPTKKNKAAANAAYAAAFAAAFAASAAAFAAFAAYAAANAAYAAANAAYAAANAAYAAAYAAANAATSAAARKKLRLKIIKFGLTMLDEK